MGCERRCLRPFKKILCEGERKMTVAEVFPQRSKSAIYPMRRSDLSVRIMEGETVVLDRHRRLIHQLNKTASYIWERCDGKSTVAEIANELAEAFRIDVDGAERDTARVMRELESLGLI